MTVTGELSVGHHNFLTFDLKAKRVQSQAIGLDDEIVFSRFSPYDDHEKIVIHTASQIYTLSRSGMSKTFKMLELYDKDGQARAIWMDCISRDSQ